MTIPEPVACASSRRSVTLAGWSLAVWSIAYVLPHLYWGLGGETGLSAVRPSASAMPEWEDINLVASLVLTIPAAIGIGLIRFAGERRVARPLLIASWLGVAIAAGHGLFGIVYRTLHVAGVTDIDGRSFELDRHGWVLWDLLVFEPWFLIEGILFAAVGRAALTGMEAKRRWTIACVVGVALATLSGIVGVRVG